MNMIRNVTLAGVAALAVIATPASATTISYSGPASVNVNDSFSLTILGDFADGLVAGGQLFTYDNALVSLDSVDLIASADPAFSCPGGGNCGATDGAGTEAIHYGSFTQIVGAGTVGATMATVHLTALAAGLASFGGADDVNGGGWFDLNFADATPSFIGTDVQIVSAVPVPAAVWLFGSGLLGLVGVARRKAA